MNLVDLPSAIYPPVEHKANKAWRREQRQATRREFIRLTVTAALGAGLAFVSLMPTARQARAHNPRTSTYQQTEYCSTSRRRGFAGNTGCCNCGSHVSTFNCDSQGWHHHHTKTALGTNLRYQYKQQARCHDEELSGRYAWLWRRNGVNWRCSDGIVKVCWVGRGGGCSCWQDTVCPYVV